MLLVYFSVKCIIQGVYCTILCTMYYSVQCCTILYNTVQYLPTPAFQDTVNKLDGVISTKVNLEQYLPTPAFQDTVNKLDGVISTKVNLESCEALVQHYSDTISALAIESCINSIGKFT